MLFWIIAFALAALCLIPIALTLLRDRRDGAVSPDMVVYRDQLDEIERDLARGVLTEDEATRTRTEVARRLLEAEAREAGPQGRKGPGRVGAAIAALLVLAGTAGVYFWIGAPGVPDLPLSTRLEQAQKLRESRPSQAELEERVAAARPDDAEEIDPNFTQLMERLRATMADRPDDLEGWTLLARNEARLMNFAAAAEAQDRVLELKGDKATTEDATDAVELRIYAAGGIVSTEAEQRLDSILAVDLENPRARYYKGLALAQIGRPDMTFTLWRPVLETQPAGTPVAEAIRGQIGEIAMLAGVRYDPPATAPGPDASDMAAAAEMDPEARQQMIRSMVDGLSERLATEGGSPDEWARLIRALGVLGETDRAKAIVAEARQVFAASPEAVQLIEQTARDAGLAE
ncbi:c-type cytochrome biogenesis protein CcmI [Palleronia caenipelagi]|uniref:C-type cytochrome biogenesis protein CcmI n=1 Tax=Palleronia caenipelagi TaxID=2489174 RepID=A0A547QB49_9RHOB|nr:c-type cytochrome biogenesis protein CcmI [Palleronia caenipelagi]TRD23608.1 c-type cytochrome biogenesis protein CcmI [Palleronia caenipelagi]